MLGWGKKAEAETSLKETLLPAKNSDVLEYDEMWSYIRTKRNQSWLWLVICRRTRQVLAYAIGDRSKATCLKLWAMLPKEYRHRRSFSDFWSVYQEVLPARTHHPVGKESGETAHIERFNNTLRQRLGCLVRKTLSFSKDAYWHWLRIRLFLLRYNRQRRDEYLWQHPEEATRLLTNR
jgi:insertion element IS1 protein InsB